jgi:hypothetical protein
MYGHTVVDAAALLSIIKTIHIPGGLRGKTHCNYDCERCENDTAIDRNKTLERVSIQ